MNKSILLVEDEMLSTFIAKRIIEIVDSEWVVNAASNGKEALQWFGENQKQNTSTPTVIILDLHMPIMGGFEFLREFRKLDLVSARPRIFVMSSSIDASDEQEAIALGATGFISKPFNEDVIRKILKS